MKRLKERATRQACLLFAISFLPVQATWAQTGTCQRGGASEQLAVNGVRADLYNNGNLFRDFGGPRYEVHGNNAIFASSLWIGGMVDGELRVSGSNYGPWEMWPGPLDESGNPPADCSAFDRMYEINVGEIVDYNDSGILSPGLVDWPWQLGAPVEDGDGDPNNYNLPGGDRPALEGHQSVWWVMNDAGNSHEFSQTEPIGMEVQTMASGAYSESQVVHNATFYRYTLTYKGSTPFDSVYVGMFVDADVGNAGDDYVGSDTTLGLAYTWNGDDFDEGEGGGIYVGYQSLPPAIGYMVLDGIGTDADGLDNDRDGQVDEEGEQIGMSKFLSFENDDTPTGFARDGEEMYGYLRGEWRDGVPITFGGPGRGFSNARADFMFSGNPPEFWSEENVDDAGSRNEPGDRRFVWSVGPFNMSPGETKEMVVAIVFARGSDRFESVQLLKEGVTELQALYDGGFQFDAPSRPGTPMLSAPGDGATEQPTNAVIQWEPADRASEYFIEIGKDVGRGEPVVSFEWSDRPQTTLNLDWATTYSWRVQAWNVSGVGPWSEERSFSTSTNRLVGGGVLNDGGRPAFIQVQGIGDDDACGPNAGSTFGCDLWGGNFVYGSFNGQGNWIMNAIGTGPEETLPDYAPNDFEIRSTEAGSYAYGLFQGGEAIWVPLEVWDVGPVGPFGVNDPEDDVQMITTYFSDNGGTCLFGFGEEDEDPFGLGWPGTDRVYAYYPVNDDYAAWEAAVKPLVDAHAEGCPALPETDGLSDLIDEARGRPIQRLIFYMDPFAESYRQEFIPVGNIIRFLTTGSADVAPVLSAPANGAEVMNEVTLWWLGADHHQLFELQVSRESGFSDLDIALDSLTSESETVRLENSITYYWRVRGIDGRGQAGNWSRIWQFEVAAMGVAVENSQFELPLVQTLLPNYPNPFSSLTTIKFGLPQPERVRLAVYDLLGRQVLQLMDRSVSAGWHSVTFDASGLSGGAYLYRLETSASAISKKMVLSR